MKWFFAIIITSILISLVVVATNNYFSVQNTVTSNIDSLNYSNQNIQISELTFEKCIEKLTETETHILSSNAISYLFQVLTILIISIGFYLLSRIELKIEKIKAYERNVSNALIDSEKSTEIINTTNTILALSSGISEEDAFSIIAIQNAFIIEDQLESLIRAFQDPSLRLSKKHSEYCGQVFDNIIGAKFNRINSSDDYFRPISDLINSLLILIKEVRHRK